jgi:hypothetical protein
MLRFWSAIFVSVFFYAKVDILIWQRIFETNELWDLGIGVYHKGWLQVLFGFMILGTLLFYPSLRRMITFPLSVAILAFSGAEDILYYWLDGRAIPAELPWLNSNPLILKPVTDERLLISAGFWLLVIVAIERLSKTVEVMVGQVKEKRLEKRLPSAEFIPHTPAAPPGPAGPD